MFFTGKQVNLITFLTMRCMQRLEQISYPEIGDGNFNITHSHFTD